MAVRRRQGEAGAAVIVRVRSPKGGWTAVVETPRDEDPAWAARKLRDLGLRARVKGDEVVVEADAGGAP